MNDSLVVNHVSEFIEIINSLLQREEQIAEEQQSRLQIMRDKEKSQNAANYYNTILTNRNTEKEQRFMADKTDILGEKTGRHRYKFFYRGHYKASYILCPSVFRDNFWEYEDYFYHRIMVERADAFRNTSHLDKLVTMQHYSCPTRLLDVTSNPLVALYFACMNYGCEKCNSSVEGAVLVFPVPVQEISYADSDRALMLSCLPRFSREEKDLLLQCANDSLTDKSFPQVKGGSRYRDSIVERFYHEITTEISSFKREIDPIDLLQPLFVQPNKTNGRIIKQDGAFIINGLSKDRYEAKDKLDTMAYEIIYVHNQQSVLRELDLLGINEASLFPEVDKMAEYLKSFVKNPIRV